MNLLFFIIFVYYCQLPCMDYQSDSISFMKNIFKRDDLEKMYEEATGSESSFVEEYFKETDPLKQQTFYQLGNVIGIRCLDKADPLTYQASPHDTVLDNAMAPFRTTLEKLFFQHTRHHHSRIIEEINSFILEVTKKLYFDAQRFDDFTPEFIPTQIKKAIFTETTSLLKTQQYYCVAMHHYYAGLCLQPFKKQSDEYNNYENAIEHFCLSGTPMLNESLKDNPAHIQIIYKIVGYLLGIKGKCEETESNLKFICDNQKFIRVKILVSMSSDIFDKILWRTLSQTSLSQMRKITAENSEIFQQIKNSRNK